VRSCPPLRRVTGGVTERRREGEMGRRDGATLPLRLVISARCEVNAKRLRRKMASRPI
jgi:hypothetical protein